MDLEKLKYPIGPLSASQQTDSSLISGWIEDIATFPAQLREAVEDLNHDQLSWPYRPGGWTIRQVVHHCADSHMNALIRFKLALTEDQPTIKPYEEAKWALLPDMETDLQPSLMMLDGLHNRWAILLNSLSSDQLKLQYYHPEHQKHFDLQYTIYMYSWHCRHHLAHVHQAAAYEGKF